MPLESASYPLLWYTSHSPQQDAMTACEMLRYIVYHAGKHGTGYKRKRTAIPLATGQYVHLGLQMIGQWVVDWQQAHPNRRLLEVDPEVIAWAAGETAADYEYKARAKGLMLTPGDVETNEAVEQLIMEQRTLVEALVWVYAIVRLPYMLSNNRMLGVELEMPAVLDCSCGLGDWIGSDVDHAKRGCLGIVQQGRTDFLWEGVHDGTITYEEFKVNAQPRHQFEVAWNHSNQLLINMETAGKRIGKVINTAYIPVLYKGWRGRDKGAPPTEPKYQHSPLAYGWYDSGNPPLRDPEWKGQYEWVDDYTGKKHRLGGAFKRVPVWDDSRPLNVIRTGASRVENWIRGYITETQVGSLITTLGPFTRQEHRIPDAIASIQQHERSWRQRVELLRDNKVYEPSHPMVAQVIGRSWNCTRYDGSPCVGAPICFKEPGYESIEAMGRYEIRTPHHAPEKAAWEALGLVFPDDGDEDGGDE